MNIFEQATRQQLRFTSAAGQLTTEDLWRLPLEGNVSLDAVAQRTNVDLLKSNEKSFVKTNTINLTLELKMDILKHIIASKLYDLEVSKSAKKDAVRKDKLVDALVAKEADELKEKSTKQLKKELKELS